MGCGYPLSKITSYQIAKLAGVSQATVSRALRNDKYVNSETRDKILQIAKAHNYSVDVRARNLRSQNTKTIALLFFEEYDLIAAPINQFFHAMLFNITRASIQQGYDLLVSFQQSSDNWDRDFDDAHRADGIIFLGYGDYMTYAKSIAKLKTKFISWGPVLPDQPGYFIGCDNFQSGYLATQHLIQLGRKKIAFFGDTSEHFPEFKQRYLGYLKAHQEAELPTYDALQVDCKTSEDCGCQAAKILLSRGIKFDGLFGASDLIVIGAIKSFYEYQLKVPDDVSVVGFDNIASSLYFNPSITTIEQDAVLAGKLLVENLINLIEGKSISSIQIASKLIVRESCGARVRG